MPQQLQANHSVLSVYSKQKQVYEMLRSHRNLQVRQSLSVLATWSDLQSETLPLLPPTVHRC